MAIQQKKLKNNNLLVLDDDLLFEVLGRLPPKSLYICKSVCKGLFSIISRPEFITSYRNLLEKSRRLLLSIRDGKGLFSNQRYLLGSADLLNIEECLSVPYTTYYGVTQVINSLVCFYIACRVRLCNLTTSEILDLPLSSVTRGGWAQNFLYFFGFDPISGTYKLLKIKHHYCEVLTLGENMYEDSWKSLGEIYVPFDSEPEEAFCVDGVLYWLQGYENREVVSFDLNRHQFDCRFLPDCLSSSYTIGAALQFRGCLAFAYIRVSHFNIFSQSHWTKHTFELPTEPNIFSQSHWTKHTFELPTELVQQCNSMIPIGSLPTGEIMLVDADRFTTIYSYDPENQKFERFVVPDQLGSKIHSAHISSFEANFSPLSLILKQN